MLLDEYGFLVVSLQMFLATGGSEEYEDESLSRLKVLLDPFKQMFVH